jgi:hypothetical protein
VDRGVPTLSRATHLIVGPLGFREFIVAPSNTFAAFVRYTEVPWQGIVVSATDHSGTARLPIAVSSQPVGHRNLKVVVILTVSSLDDDPLIYSAGGWWCEEW